MTAPADQLLYAIAELAGNLRYLWSDYQTIEANLAAPTMAAPGSGDGRGSDVPDPTHGIAASHLAYWGTVDDIAIALHHLRSAQRRMNQVLRHHAPLAHQLDQAAKAARCDGSVDPTCVNNAVRLFRDTNQSLCWRCIKQIQRARETAAS